jgi:hypothetical protein
MKKLSKIRGWFPSDPAINASTKKPKLSTLTKQPTLKDRLVGGLGAAGGGLVIMGIFFSFVSSYPKLADYVLLVLGIPLLVAAILVRRTNKY